MAQESIREWLNTSGLDPEATLLFCCFSVNNQYRILAGGDQAGSDDLENIFEARLLKIGRVVALLDHWQEPRYLKRILLYHIACFDVFMVSALHEPR